MSERNGWIKWLVGALWGLLILAVTMTANGVITNDIKSTQEHTSIRKEFLTADEKIVDKIEKTIKEIQVAQVTLLVQNQKILTILENLQNKN